MSRDFASLIAPFARKINGLLVRAVVTMVNQSAKMQTLQLQLQNDELKDSVEHFEPYGMTAHPPAGAEALAAFFNGDRSHGVVISVAHRQYRLRGLQAGEVALYDDQGQTIHLTRAGIVISGAGNPVVIQNCSKVRMVTALLEVTGDIKDNCDGAGKSMSAMRQTYNSHTHAENNAGSTNAPNQSM